MNSIWPLLNRYSQLTLGTRVVPGFMVAQVPGYYGSPGYYGTRVLCYHSSPGYYGSPGYPGSPNLQAASYKRRLQQHYDKACNKSCNTCTSLATLISIILCLHNIMRELATCSQSQRTVQSMISAACSLNALLTGRHYGTWRNSVQSPYWFLYIYTLCDVQPPISLQILLQL